MRLVMLEPNCANQSHTTYSSRTRIDEDIMENLRDKLESGQFYLRWQPIVTIAEPKNDPTKYEVLLGISKDTIGYSVEEFFQQAEKKNRTQIIDQWVIEQIIDWFRFNSLGSKKIARININLSASTLNNTAQIDRVLNKLSTGDLPGEKVCFEITETGAIENLNQVADFMKAAKQFSCQFALDDFGMGYCSFQYLEKLPVDCIKIDGRFITELPKSKEAYAIVRAIKNIADELNMTTVAEWIESPEVLTIVRDLGITYGQGKLFGMPKALPKCTRYRQDDLETILDIPIF